MRASLLGSTLAVLVGCGVAASLAIARPSTRVDQASFIDVVGDGGQTAPDLSVIDVTANGPYVDWKLHFANRPDGMKPLDAILIVIDADDNAATGCTRNGGDAKISAVAGFYGALGAAAAIARCNGGAFGEYEESGFLAGDMGRDSDGGTMSFRIAASALGDPGFVRFWVQAGSLADGHNPPLENDFAPSFGLFSVQRTVFAGPLSCRVPSVVGMPLAKAREELTLHACRVGTIRRVTSRAAAKGRVIRQAPRAGAKLKAFARVDLAVGRGPKR